MVIGWTSERDGKGKWDKEEKSMKRRGMMIGWTEGKGNKRGKRI
jgi:hypothetical protein